MAQKKEQRKENWMSWIAKKWNEKIIIIIYIIQVSAHFLSIFLLFLFFFLYFCIFLSLVFCVFLFNFWLTTSTNKKRLKEWRTWNNDIKNPDDERNKWKFKQKRRRRLYCILLCVSFKDFCESLENCRVDETISR